MVVLISRLRLPFISAIDEPVKAVPLQNVLANAVLAQEPHSVDLSSPSASHAAPLHSKLSVAAVELPGPPEPPACSGHGQCCGAPQDVSMLPSGRDPHIHKLRWGCAHSILTVCGVHNAPAPAPLCWLSSGRVSIKSPRELATSHWLVWLCSAGLPTASTSAPFMVLATCSFIGNKFPAPPSSPPLLKIHLLCSGQPAALPL